MSSGPPARRPVYFEGWRERGERVIGFRARSITPVFPRDPDEAWP